MIELYKLDSDVLVGHNLSGFDLDVLLNRAQVSIFRLFSTRQRFLGCFICFQLFLICIHECIHFLIVELNQT